LAGSVVLIKAVVGRQPVLVPHQGAAHIVPDLGCCAHVVPDAHLIHFACKIVAPRCPDIQVAGVDARICGYRHMLPLIGSNRVCFHAVYVDGGAAETGGRNRTTIRPDGMRSAVKIHEILGGTGRINPECHRLYRARPGPDIHVIVGPVKIESVSRSGKGPRGDPGRSVREHPVIAIPCVVSDGSGTRVELIIDRHIVPVGVQAVHLFVHPAADGG